MIQVIPPPDESDKPDGKSALTSSGSTDSGQFTSSVSFKVDDFTGAAHLSYPIVVPPARDGLAPSLSLNYSSSGPNSWVGVGWDLSVGFIQRRGARKGVPKYDSTDVFEIQSGGSPQELVSIGNNEYRLRVEGALLKIQYFSTGNYWQVMKFGQSDASRINRTPPYQPSGSTTYRWCLDRVEDLKTNYMNIYYQTDLDGSYVNQLYLWKIQYNGQTSGGLSPNHEILFNRKTLNRDDFIYNYRGGFKSLTRNLLESIEIRTGGNPVRKYQLQYDTPNSKSVLSQITLYGNDNFTSSLPPTKFSYQVHNAGFQEGKDWPNPSAWNNLGGNLIRNTSSANNGIYTDVIDMNGDALPDRVIYDRGGSPWQTWKVYFNTGGEFDSGESGNGTNWANPSAWNNIGGNYIRNNYFDGTYVWGTTTDVIDMNGDGLSDRVVYDRFGPDWHTWEFYENNFPDQYRFVSRPGWTNPSAWNNIGGNLIRNTHAAGYGTYTDVIDMNGDGLPDRVVYDKTSPYDTWTVYFNTGSKFGSGVDWPNPSAWSSIGGNYIRNNYFDGTYVLGTSTDVFDIDGDGLPDRIVYDRGGSPWQTWKVYLNKGPVPGLLSKIEDNGIGGSIEITYLPSTGYEDESGNKLNAIPFVVQTVNSYTQKDGKGNSYLHKYEYSGAYYDSSEVEFRGFHTVTAYQMATETEYESKTVTTYIQNDYFKKGRPLTQTLTSREGHTRTVENTWVNISTAGGGNFPSLTQTTSTITDVGTGGPFVYSHQATYAYDQYLNLSEEHKYGATSLDEIHTYFSYLNLSGLESKPTEITVKNSAQSIVSRKWMVYDSSTGNITTEEVCKSDTPSTGCSSRNSVQNPVITYQYYTDGTLWKIIDPMSCVTTLNYDSTKTFVYETINCLNHKTTTEYDPGTGNLKKLIPPHLQGTAYSITQTYDVFGRKIREDRPDTGYTSYQYLNLSNPATQYVEKREHIVGGVSVLDHYTYNYFDGMGRTYKIRSTGPAGETILTETTFDEVGRVKRKYNPRFETAASPYPFTELDYDGLSRVIDTLTPDSYHITASYQGLRKVVTDQIGHSTANTFDIYQRLKKVEDPYGTVTEYAYDTLGNLIQVIAAKNNTEQNTTTMTYDSLSKKRTMTDPDMGYWTYSYDKSGNLISQTDAKSQTINFFYDSLNRLTQKVYPAYTITYSYDDPSIPYSKGKLTKVSDPSGGLTKEDSVLEYDLMQRVKKSQKKIGADWVNFEKTYDSAGRVLSMKYLADTPSWKLYNYEYDVAGNLLYVKENVSGDHLVDYSIFTALGQHKIATFPKPNNISVKTTYTYHPQTARIQTLLTQKLTGGTPTETYQNLNYQQFDGKGNLITLADALNGITHSYTYDFLDRLLTANGVGNNPYTQTYAYDRIGNITNKSDVGSYTYYYNSKPHAVRSAGNITLQYDLNGNMTQRAVTGGDVLDITYTYDDKPDLIKRNNINHVQFSYDGNGQRVKKQNYSTGQTTLYFGGAYEVRGTTGIIHVFAGNQRIASVRTDGRVQFYHSNHLGSASVITDANGNRKQQIEYHPFGTYRAVGSTYGTYDYDPAFPNVNYTFTDQEDDDDLGLYNYGARLYDPLLGRFISPDSIVQAPGDPQTLNRYTYCLNNPLIYTDPSGEFIAALWSFLAPLLLLGSPGMYSAYRSGQDTQGIITAGAISAAINAAGILIGMGVGSIVTSLMKMAEIGATSSAANIVGSMAGGFSGGAVSGGGNAAVNGGNAWQGALYGGLIGAAVAGTVAGAIELNNWANSDASTVIKDPKTGQLKSVKPFTEKELHGILRITSETKVEAEGYLGEYGHIRIFSRFDFGGATKQQIMDTCFSGSGCNRAFDLFADEAWKIDNLHIRAYSKPYGYEIRFHLDRVALTGSFGNFAKHFWFDMVVNTYYAVRQFGWGGFAEGL
jgi:RHS repeat-associated protein